MELDNKQVKRIARDMYILQDCPLETISKTLDIPLRKLENWDTKEKWTFIKGNMTEKFGSQLLDLNGAMTEVYLKSMEKAVSLLDGVRTPRQMSELMNAIRMIDEGLVQHYGINSLIKTVKENEKLGLM